MNYPLFNGGHSGYGQKMLALDSETKGKIKSLAHQWEVSEEEAIRRAVNLASSTEIAARLASFRELRDSLNLDKTKAEEWKQIIRDARR